MRPICLAMVTYHNMLNEDAYRVRVLAALRALAGWRIEGAEPRKYLILFETLRPFCSRRGRKELRGLVSDLNWRILVFPVLPEKHPIVMRLNLLLCGVVLRLLHIVIGFRIVHAQSHSAAYIAAVAKGFGAQFKMLFDAHGADVEERVLRGQLTEGSWLHGRFRSAENLAVRYSDALVSVTNTLQLFLSSQSGYSPEHKSVVPCFVDEPAELRVVVERRSVMREKLGMAGRIVLGYLGSFATWQAIDEMITLFRSCVQMLDQVHILIISTSRERFAEALRLARIPGDRYTILAMPHAEVPHVLPAMDLGVLLRHDSIVNRVACPTKFAEYLASGVPVLVTEVLEDMASLAQAKSVGLVWPDPEPSPARTTELLASIGAVMADRRNVADRCQRVAREAFGQHSGQEKYIELYSTLVNSNYRKHAL